MLARLQQFIVFALLGIALGWAGYFASSSPWLAAAGFFTILFGYSIFLALEFLLLHKVNQGDPAPRATVSELLSAWWGETCIAPLVFCWRLPFRHNAMPDNLTPKSLTQGKRGVVFVHGFFCNRGFWNPWLERLRGSGHAYMALSLEPVFASIDDYTPMIDAAVVKLTQATGKRPLIVCHSMGGLAVRAWLQTAKAEARVHHVVTIGTPHRGTWLARFSHSENGRQMRLASDWQTGLDLEMPASRHTLFTCWFSTADNIVFPASNATLPGADNRLIRGKAHVQMAFAPQILDATLAML